MTTCSLVLLLFPLAADAQYFLGVGGGPYWVETGSPHVTDMRAYEIGARLISRSDDALGYAAHIDLQQRRFHARGYPTDPSLYRYHDLQMMLQMLAVGCDARIPLATAKTIFLDIGPEFCIQLSEDKDGMAYTRDYNFHDTITYHHDTRTLFEIRDIRLRAGFSGDVHVSESLLANFGLHGSIGSGPWSFVASGLSLGLQLSGSLLFDVRGKGSRK